MASAKWTSTTKANGNVADNGSQTIIIQFKPPLPLSLNEDDIINYLREKGFDDFVTSDSVQFVEEDTHVTFNNASIVPNVIRNIKGTLLQGQYKVKVVYLMSDGPPSPAKPKSYSQAVSSHAAPKAGQGSGHPTAPSQSKKATPVSVTQRHPPVLKPAAPQQQPPVPRPAAPQQQPPVPRPAAPQHQPPVPRPVAPQRQPIQSFPGVPATAKLVTSLPDPPSGRLEQRPQGSTFTQRDTSSVAASQPDVVTTRSAQRTAGQSQGGVASRGAKGASSNSSQTRTPSQSQAQAQSQSQAPNQSQAQSQPQAHSQSQAPNQSQAQSQSQAHSQAQAPNQSQPQAQSQSQAQAPIQSQPQGSSLPPTQQRGKPPPFQEPPHLLADQSSPPPPSSGGCTLIIRGLRPTLRDGELRNEIVKLDVVLDQCKLSLREDGMKEAILKVSQEADARHIQDELPESTDLGEKITITIIP